MPGEIDNHLPNNIELLVVVVPEDFKPELVRLAAEADVGQNIMLVRLAVQGARCKKQDHDGRPAR